MNDQIIKLSEVIRITGLSYASIARYEKAGKFPKRRKLGGRAVGWLSSEINQWITKQTAVGSVRDYEVV